MVLATKLAIAVSAEDFEQEFLIDFKAFLFGTVHSIKIEVAFQYHQSNNKVVEERHMRAILN